MTIDELRREYRNGCDSACFTRKTGIDENHDEEYYMCLHGIDTTLCTICEDGECPRPTSPDKLISGVKNNTDGHGVSTNEVRHDG